jgi:hypothetical protein
MGKAAELDKNPMGAKGALQPAGKQDAAGPPAERLDQQSRAGIASFVLSLVAAAAIVHTVLRFQGFRSPDGAGDGWLPVAAVYVTVVFGGALAVEVVALVLGFMGTFQKKSRRTLGIAGIALSAAMLLAVLSVPLLK